MYFQSYFIITISVYYIKPSNQTLNDAKYPPVNRLTASHGYSHFWIMFPQYCNQLQVIIGLVWNVLPLVGVRNPGIQQKSACILAV